MYNILVENTKFHHDVEELVKLFLDRSSFRIIATLNDISENDNDEILIPTELNNKQEIKRYLYGYFSKKLEYQPPWGTLTGIRPTKIVNELYKQGKNKETVINILSKEYLLKENKIDLLIATTENQKYINKNLPDKSISIYIGIPFCPSRCSYCSFTSYEISEKKSSAYLEALYKEISHISKAIDKKGIKVETIYIGGGTPTSLSNKHFEEFINNVGDSFDLKRLKEFTVEAGRPDTINENKVKILLKNNCNRISINPQSMNQKTLVEIGRKHSIEMIIEAFNLVRSSGIETINMDVIAGLPNEKIDDFLFTLDKIIKLQPQNITIHNLAIKRAARLKENIVKLDNVLIKPNELVEMLEKSYEVMSENHYHPYYLYRQKDMLGNLENIGYSLKGHESIYNVRIMEENQTIIALGAGGVSKIYYESENRLERIPNVSNFEVYIERIDEMIKRKDIDIFQ